MGECLILRAGSGVDTSGANATSDKILQGYTGYVNDVLVTGNIPIYVRNNNNKVTTLTTDDVRPIYSLEDSIGVQYTDSPNDGDGVRRSHIKIPFAGYYLSDSILAAPWSEVERIIRINHFSGDNAYIQHIVSGYSVCTRRGLIQGSMPYWALTYNPFAINGTHTINAGCHDGSGTITQNIPTQGGVTITPNTSNLIVCHSGRYTTSPLWVAGSGNLVPGNIKKGVNIFGVVGNWQGF